jgi:broad specificity phosphatase PhoE
MKLYILRHEDRTQDCSMFAPLTKNGLIRAEKLVPLLESIKIDIVFSSPFVRTLQTVKPYLKKGDKKVNIEYSLSEIHHEDIIPKKAYGMYLPEYIAEQYNYNPEYKSFIKPTDIIMPERFKNVDIRLKKFLGELFNEYITTDKTILLVTHQALCGSILHIVNKYNKLDEEIINNYMIGQLTLVYNNNWTYKHTK